jgi:hypothetical protein
MIKPFTPPTRNRVLEDWITTILGLISAVALVMAENGFYPRIAGAVSGVALALLGVFTNKPLR